MKSAGYKYFYIPIALGVLLLLVGTLISGPDINDEIVHIIGWGSGFICISIGLLGIGIANILEKK